MNVLDRVVSYVNPAAGLRRVRARAAADIIAGRKPGDPRSSLRHYEGAAAGRRTQGWSKTNTDANAALATALSTLRNVARDLVRNNGYAESAVTTIRDHTVGFGITPKSKNAAAMKAWEAWASETSCDADGRLDFAGIQGLVIRTVAESGECIVRRRRRLPEDKLPLPVQVQVLEPDYIDTAKMDAKLPNGGRILHGVEFDAIGRCVAYWLFPEHPGALTTMTQASRRVPAEDIRHIFRIERPGQIRGASWFAPVMLKFKDFDEYEDATLMKQKVAACLAVITSDNGSGTYLGQPDSEDPMIDRLEPGMVARVAPGSSIEVVQPPSTADFPAYSKTALRAIATGLGVTYEDLTGDFSEVNFSSARMARLKHWARVEEWRWHMLVPQLCAPVWAWVMEAAAVAGGQSIGVVKPESWTASPLPMIEPDSEGLAYQRLIRSGLMSLSEALRERGYDPDTVLAEIASDNAKIDRLKLVLDSDPRNTSQAGQPVATTAATPPPEPAATTKPAAAGQPAKG